MSTCASPRILQIAPPVQQLQLRVTNHVLVIPGLLDRVHGAETKVIAAPPEIGRFIPLIDARIGEVVTAVRKYAGGER